MSWVQKRKNLLEIILSSLMFLVFFQLLTDFTAGIYAFALLGTGIPVEIAAFLLLFSPAILLVGGKVLKGKSLVVAGELVLICRVIEPMLGTRSRMLVAGLGAAILLVFFPSLIWNKRTRLAGQSGLFLTAGLAGSVGLSIMLRSLNSSVDLSLDGVNIWVGWLLAAIAALLLAILLPVKPTVEASSEPANPAEQPAGSRGRVVGLCLGLVGVLLAFYYAFTSPAVIARWVEGNYLWIILIAGGSLSLFGILFVWRPARFTGISPLVLLAYNLLFLISLLLTISPHQLSFPVNPSDYPFFEPSVSPITILPLVLTLLLYPVLIVDFLKIGRALAAANASPRLFGAGFTLASLYLLLMIFAHVFTTTYDYIPVIGPFFRDQFWLVYLVAGLVPALAVLLTGGKKLSYNGSEKGQAIPPAFAWGLFLVTALAGLGVVLTMARPDTQSQGRETIRVMTYNIRQGYSDAGLKNYDGQLDLISQIAPDIIGLQESDTNRIANGNSDIVRYFADRLGMYSYFGPKTVTGTFGIALLSIYPIQNARTFYMYSEGEQTATIEAQIVVGNKTFNVYVTHLGNGGPIVQQEAVLEVVGDKGNVIAMGDFNFRPDTDQYRLTTERLQDAWLLKWPTGVDDEGYNPDQRIDHIFVSPGMVVRDMQYWTGPESDHPAAIAEILRQ